LNSLPRLREEIEEKWDVPQSQKREAEMFVDALKAFDDVRLHTFGYSLLPNWWSSILDFQEAYSKLEISITTKVHIILDHLMPFLEDHKSGLGKFSEQCFESIHYDWLDSWKNYLVKDMKSVSFGQKLLNCGNEFNAIHAGIQNKLPDSP
jgi:hypothetical protein